MSNVLANHLFYYPTPTNINYAWSFGSLVGIIFTFQIISGIFLAMHYTPHTEWAFASVEHIMTEVNGGYLFRYFHANGASMIFILMYTHMARGLYFQSYVTRPGLWNTGLVIFLVVAIYLISPTLLTSLLEPTSLAANNPAVPDPSAVDKNVINETKSGFFGQLHGWWNSWFGHAQDNSALLKNTPAVVVNTVTKTPLVDSSGTHIWNWCKSCLGYNVSREEILISQKENLEQSLLGMRCVSILFKLYGSLGVAVAVDNYTRFLYHRPLSPTDLILISFYLFSWADTISSWREDTVRALDRVNCELSQIADEKALVLAKNLEKDLPASDSYVYDSWTAFNEFSPLIALAIILFLLPQSYLLFCYLRGKNCFTTPTVFFRFKSILTSCGYQIFLCFRTARALYWALILLIAFYFVLLCFGPGVHAYLSEPITVEVNNPIALMEAPSADKTITGEGSPGKWTQFKNWCKSWVVVTETSAAYNIASSGMAAETAVINTLDMQNKSWWNSWFEPDNSVSAVDKATANCVKSSYSWCVAPAVGAAKFVFGAAAVCGGILFMVKIPGTGVGTACVAVGSYCVMDVLAPLWNRAHQIPVAVHKSVEKVVEVAPEKVRGPSEELSGIVPVDSWTVFSDFSPLVALAIILFLLPQLYFLYHYLQSKNPAALGNDDEDGLVETVLEYLLILAGFTLLFLFFEEHSQLLPLHADQVPAS